MHEQEVRLKQLFLRGLTGDEAAYHGFLKALGAHLRAFFRRRLAWSPEDSEDLVQETLLAIHAKRHTYRDGQPLTAWVHAIARYKLVDWLRSRNVRAHVNEPMDEEHREMFAAAYNEAPDARHDLEALLQLLPDKQRQPLIHMKLEGLSVEETARRTGLSASAVKVGVHRGLKTLIAGIRKDR